MNSTIINRIICIIVGVIFSFLAVKILKNKNKSGITLTIIALFVYNFAFHVALTIIFLIGGDNITTNLIISLFIPFYIGIVQIVAASKFDAAMYGTMYATAKALRNIIWVIAAMEIVPAIVWTGIVHFGFGKSDLKSSKKASAKIDDTADKLLKYKELYDNNIISKDEFDKVKSEILGETEK